MLLATPADMRATFGVEEIAALTRLYMEACPPGEPPAEGEETPAGRTEEAVLSWAVARASSRAVSYLAARYPALATDALPEGLVIPPSLVNAVCDIARYYLTGTPVQETDPIAERYKDALAWLREIAAGEAGLPGLDAAGGDEDEELVAGGVVFVSNERQWSTTQ